MKKYFLTPIEDYIIEDFGVEGTPEREKFEREVDAFYFCICKSLYIRDLLLKR